MKKLSKLEQQWLGYAQERVGQIRQQIRDTEARPVYPLYTEIDRNEDLVKLQDDLWLAERKVKDIRGEA